MGNPLFENVSKLPPKKFIVDLFEVYPGENFSTTSSFFIGLLIIPLIILVLAVICIMIYQMAICCRCCISCYCPTRCKCCFVQDRSFIQGDFKTRAKYYKYTLITFGIFWTLAFIFTFMMVLPYQNLQGGLKYTSDSLNIIYKLLVSIIFAANFVIDGIITVSTAITAEPCYTAFKTLKINETLIDKADSAYEKISTLVASISSIPGFVTDAQDVLTYTVGPISTTIFWYYFGIMLIILFLWLLVFYIRKKKYLTFMNVITEIVILILAVISCVELYVAHLNASYCYPSPTYNTLLQFSPNNPALPTMVHYMTCEGAF